MKKSYLDIISHIFSMILAILLVTYLKDPFLTIFIGIVILSIVKLLKSTNNDNKVK